MTGIFSEKTYAHLLSNDLFPSEQKGCRRESQGTKDHLIVDKFILRNCKRRHTNLSMAWIDFKKAYDMVPHSWIIGSLRMFGIADNVVELLSESMNNWRTTIFSGGKQLGTVEIKRGIFQGDAFSPLLFVIALIPLSMALRESGMGYKLGKTGPTINHLLFMVDIKLFAKNDNEIDSLVHTVRICSSDIGMEMGISKCALVTMKRGKHVKSLGIKLPRDEEIADADSRGYKYLGILELDSIMSGDMKAKVKETYLTRLKLILKSKLNSPNLITAMNSWAVAVVRYSAGLIDWTKEEVRELDRVTRKLMFEHSALHPKSNVIRLYMKRKNGGRGLTSIEECVASEARNLDEYIANSKEESLSFVANEVPLQPDDIEGKNEYSSRIQKEKLDALIGMPLHGQFERETRDLKTEDSWAWLKNGDLKRETESLLMAAQEQALNTNSIKKHIYACSESSLCRLCGEKEENVSHIISSCKMLAQNEYKCRHDKICSNVHWNLCKKFGFDVSDKWYQHRIDKVLESEKVKILWDFDMQTDRVIEHRRPDILLINKETNECFIIDIAVPADYNIDKKEFEKISKYSELKVELSRMLNKKTFVIPIVIGALGSIPKRLHSFAEKLGIRNDFMIWQKSALLGTAGILRKVL